MRRIALGTVLLSIAVLGQAKEYGHYEIKSIATVSQSATGQHSVTINFSLLDQLLADLSIHNNNYPAQFDTAEDRQRAVRDVIAVSKILDILLDNPSPNAEVLLRAAEVNGIGHNLDIPGAGEKAMTDFTALLNRSPDDPRADYLYGKFLVSAGKPREAIPLLEKAKATTALNADWTLGLAYLALNARAKALESLEEYVKRVPNDKNAAKLIDAIRNGAVEFKKGSPP